MYKSSQKLQFRELQNKTQTVLFWLELNWLLEVLEIPGIPEKDPLQFLCHKTQRLELQDKKKMVI